MIDKIYMETMSKEMTKKLRRMRYGCLSYRKIVLLLFLDFLLLTAVANHTHFVQWQIFKTIIATPLIEYIQYVGAGLALIAFIISITCGRRKNVKCVKIALVLATIGSFIMLVAGILALMLFLSVSGVNVNDPLDLNGFENKFNDVAAAGQNGCCNGISDLGDFPACIDDLNKTFSGCFLDEDFFSATLDRAEKLFFCGAMGEKPCEADSAEEFFLEFQSKAEELSLTLFLELFIPGLLLTMINLIPTVSIFRVKLRKEEKRLSVLSQPVMFEDDVPDEDML